VAIGNLLLAFAFFGTMSINSKMSINQRTHAQVRTLKKQMTCNKMIAMLIFFL